MMALARLVQAESLLLVGKTMLVFFGSTTGGGP